MRKVALVFLLAVIGPSLVLAWLAVRSLQDQELVLERQRALLYQGVADGLAQQVQQAISERQREFAQRVESFALKQEPATVMSQFDEYLIRSWPMANVGFVVSLEGQGQLGCPAVVARPEAQQFLVENTRFLCSQQTLGVYWDSPKGRINLSELEHSASADPADRAVQETAFATKKGAEGVSTPAQARFSQLVADGDEGTLARFREDELQLLFWYRSPRDTSLVFGAEIRLAELARSLERTLRLAPPLTDQISVALLDDTGTPLLTTAAEPRTVGSRPFVAGKIGEVLPHWEIAVYLLDPAMLGIAARTTRLTVGLLIGVLLLAIAVGSWLIVADLRRQLTLARQKTDFVSNVSHELKTPLTTIRMFAEMLAEGRVSEPAKQERFHQVIAAEASRLTRIINNVLDFARRERGERHYAFVSYNLDELAGETFETYRPHLEAQGFRCNFEPSGRGPRIQADRDALSQAILNLLSNAEKYAGGQKEITVRVRESVGPAGHAELQVLDRGPGVPRGCEEKIFGQFFRAHESLSSGIQGSGLGLTLARQIARAHGGEVSYQAREGGGSCFTLRLPVASATA